MNLYEDLWQMVFKICWVVGNRRTRIASREVGITLVFLLSVGGFSKTRLTKEVVIVERWLRFKLSFLVDYTHQDSRKQSELRPIL